MNKFDLINVAYKSRFLFRTDAEYRDALGTTFETILSKRESKRDMEMYYGILDRKSTETPELPPLGDILDDYVQASNLYQSLDWGDRSQLASRKRFCRLLFRLFITAGKELSIDEIFKFKEKNVDKQLLRLFLPDSREDTNVIVICFILLFTFGIIRPWSDENSRSHDARDKDTVESIRKLISLIRVLEDDTPRLGSLKKPLVFKDWIKILESDLDDPESWPECTPYLMVTALIHISQICRSLVIPEEQRNVAERFIKLFMNGIWIDDYCCPIKVRDSQEACLDR